MKFVFVLLMVLLSAFGQLTSCAASINGREYVPLADWGAVNGLKPLWLKRGDEIQLSNRSTQLVFNRNSGMVNINGVNVEMSFPLAVDRGVPLVAQFDLDKTISPLLNPSRYGDTRKITTICIDPGHGGKDTGEHFGAYNEKVYTLALAMELRDQLRQAGFDVVMTRKSDKYIPLTDRAAIANSHNADLFICLHFNASPTDRAEIQGPETYCITPVGANSSNAGVESSEFGQGGNMASTPGNRNEKGSLLLAYQLERSLVRNLGANDRGVKRARFQVLRETTMPGVLIEGGFMTHPVEGPKIFSASYRRQMAAAIVNGILAYQKQTAPPALHTVPAKGKVLKSAGTGASSQAGSETPRNP
jgi:N-acetylmuramoyl-L-alanine amidase